MPLTQLQANAAFGATTSKESVKTIAVASREKIGFICGNGSGFESLDPSNQIPKTQLPYAPTTTLKPAIAKRFMSKGISMLEGYFLAK